MDNGLLHIGVRACAFACVFNDDGGGADIITSMLMVFFSIAASPHSMRRLYSLALINRTTTLDIDANMGCKIKQNYVRLLLNSRAFLFSDCMQVKKNTNTQHFHTVAAA